MMLSENMKKDLTEMRDGLKDILNEIKEASNDDLNIDDTDLDHAVISTPRLHMKYNQLFTDHTLTLKELYGFREKVKLERWKYWMGKQTDQYYNTHGVVHEKILKTDVDMYMAADEKMLLISEIVGVQKGIVDYLERCIKEIQTRNFHCKVAVDWRRFTQGGF
jgi:hypothetical protein